jgi:hypothetical protein
VATSIWTLKCERKRRKYYLGPRPANIGYTPFRELRWRRQTNRYRAEENEKFAEFVKSSGDFEAPQEDSEIKANQEDECY